MKCSSLSLLFLIFDYFSIRRLNDRSKAWALPIMISNDSVPWETALKIQEALVSEDVTISLIKSGDHRVSEPDDIARMLLATERIGNMS